MSLYLMLGLVLMVQAFSYIRSIMEKNFNSNKKLIWYFLRGSKKYFLIASVSIVIVNFLYLIMPILISYTIDNIISNKNTDTQDLLINFIESIWDRGYLRNNLYLIAIFLIGIGIVSSLFNYIYRYYNKKGAETFLETMRNDIFIHIDRLSFSWNMKNKTGDLIQRCTTDVDVLKRFVSDQMTEMIKTLLLIIFSVYFMFKLNFKLAAIAVTLIPINILYSFYSHKKMGKVFKKADEEEGKLSAVAQENLTGVRVVRAFGREIYEKERFEKQSHTYWKMWIKLDFILAAFEAVATLLVNLQKVIVVVVGAILAIKGELLAGEYIAFFAYNMILVWPIRMLGRVILGLSRAGVAIDRIRYIMSTELEDASGEEMPDMSKDIVFKNVSFAYDKNNIIEDVSFEIKGGTTVGILGGTGSGKSTLMHLLNRLYRLPEGSGKITIGGVDINSIKLDYLRKNIGMILQEPYLFSKTLKENISIGKDVSQSDIEKAVKMASLSETIENFTEGFETRVGERGVTLSGGQKQRTAIARMLVGKPPIMVFDDSLSAVDTETDAKIRKGILKSGKNSTVIIISHRLTTLMQADKILVLDKGSLVEEGTHEELLRKNGIYKKIYDIQSVAV